MQIIMFLLGLFLIGCVLYGIASGVQSIQRGFFRLANTKNGNKKPKKKAGIQYVANCQARQPK